MTTKTLAPISLPLHSVSLIEASAGTGKTHTITSLYLRLLLQAGNSESNFSRALNVEEILVVTFTELATQELKERIRTRIYETKQALLAYQQQDTSLVEKDLFLQELVDNLQDINLAITRLTLAEQNFDLAAIFTIHGFCRRVLMQYAFNSGISFDLQIMTQDSEKELLQRLMNELWRENFYPLSFPVTEFLVNELKVTSPEELLPKIKGNITAHINIETEHQSLLKGTLSEFLNKIDNRANDIKEFKQKWLKNIDELQAFLEKHKDNINSRTYPALLKRLSIISDWANGDSQSIPKELSDGYILEKTNVYMEEPFNNQDLKEIDKFLKKIDRNIYNALLFFHCRQALQQKVLEHKLHTNEKGFDDLLRLVKDALYAEQGDELATLIRYQYPFAMIDEFQDTDLQQYQIFSKIYMQDCANQEQESGFLMIGDPKQSIYKFRGADIFTYLKAAEQANERFTLKQNWRSTPELVDCVNTLFDFKSAAPFIFEDIEFTSVDAARTIPPFILDDQEEPALQIYLQEEAGEKDLAETCANSILQWLQKAEEGKANIGDNKIEPKNIAVLVRFNRQAKLVKDALLKRGINAVMLSDKNSIFNSTIAKDVLLILEACLDPNNERKILKVLSSRIFGLNQAQLLQLKQNENVWEDYVVDFMSYQKIWLQQGVLPMLHHILEQQKFGQHCSEREITDYLHLAELLQQASRLNDTESALLRWFEKEVLTDMGEMTEEQMRLESDRDLVKIVTYHKSKGLAYDLVWLPFFSISNNQLGQKDIIKTYYDKEQQQVIWNLDSVKPKSKPKKQIEKQQQIEDQIKKENFAERLRLLYVALTRAKNQVVLALPQNFSSDWNELLYVLTAGTIGIEEVIKLADPKLSINTKKLITALANKVGGDKIKWQDAEVLKHLQNQQLLTNSVSSQKLQLSSFTGKIENNWGVESFTSLSRKHQKATDKFEETQSISSLVDDALDYDALLMEQEEQTLDTEIAKELGELDQYQAAAYSPFTFPCGANVGTLLHRYFETEDFQQPVNQDVVTNIIECLQLTEDWLAPVTHWFENILSTPLVYLENQQPMMLKSIPEKDCLKEMAFFLKIGKDFNVTKLNQALKNYHHLESEALQIGELQGMLRGFIDLVFRHQGKYYLLDYKSNFLGNTMQDYTQENLSKAVSHHHYDWQYLFYTLALHCYLKNRDPHYDYQQHFGGVLYTFLRGMDGQTTNGVYFDKPALELIESLEEIFQC